MAEVLPMESRDQLFELEEAAKRIHGEDETMYDIPDYPKMDYEEIFGEPRAYKEKGLGKHIAPGMTMVFGAVFNYTQSTLYYILVMIMGLFLGFMWGLMFGVYIFMINWIIHPLYKVIFISLQLGGVLAKPFIRVALDPIFQSFGQCFSGMRGHLDVKLRSVAVGLNDTPPHQHHAKIHEIQQF